MELLELHEDEYGAIEDYARIGHRSILKDRVVRLHEEATLGLRRLGYRNTSKE